MIPLTLSSHHKIYVAGHRGMVGSALVRLLHQRGFTNIIVATHKELDLCNQQAVESFFETVRPEFVFLAAAKVGGIHANNTYKADFIYDNLVIASNIIHSAWKYKVQKLVNLGSSCIYPKHAPQPIKEEYLLSGPLEPTNEPYAIAKIAAIKLCQYFNEQYHTNFLSAMPSNLYGPGDNFELENSHVLPAMIRKFHDAKISNADAVTLWGDGTPEREFLFVEDLVQGLLLMMQDISCEDMGSHINIGYGSDISIKNLALLVKDIVGYTGTIEWTPSMPNGTPKKLMDSSTIHTLGWHATTTLEQGIALSYRWFKENYATART